MLFKSARSEHWLFIGMCLPKMEYLYIYGKQPTSAEIFWTTQAIRIQFWFFMCLATPKWNTSWLLEENQSSWGPNTQDYGQIWWCSAWYQWTVEISMWTSVTNLKWYIWQEYKNCQSTNTKIWSQYSIIIFPQL